MTVSEQKFETFLLENDIEFERVPETTASRPDYLIRLATKTIYFEIKELSEDIYFQRPTLSGIPVSSRTMGDHIRGKILDSRKQVQYASRLGFPSVLVVYNNIDPIHLFGTEDMDFISAMYGAYTVQLHIDAHKIVDRFHGKDAKLQKDRNTSFSAVGRLAPMDNELCVTLFENAFASVRLPFEKLPACFDVRRVELTH